MRLKVILKTKQAIWINNERTSKEEGTGMKNVKILLSTITLMVLLLCVACSNDKKTDTDATAKVESSESDKTDESENIPNDSTQNDVTNNDEITTDTPDDNGDRNDTTTTEKDETDKNTGNTQNQQKPTPGNKPGVQTGTTPGNDADLTTFVDYVIDNFTNSSMTQLEKAVAIHDYLTWKVDFNNYVSGTVSAESKTALGTLQNNKAVSEGYAQAFYELCKAAGFEVKIVSGTAINGVKNGYQAHSWNQINLDNVWYHVDVMMDDPVAEDKNTHPSEIILNSWDYFLISDATLKKDHKISGSANTCSSDYSSEKIAKAIASTSVGRACEYATKTDNLTNMVNSYNDGFEVYMVCDAKTAKNQVDKAISSTTKPFREFGAIDSRRGIAKINVIRIAGLTYVSSLDEMVSKVKGDMKNLDKFMFRYINPNITTISEMSELIESTLNKAGIEAFVHIYYEEILYGRFDFFLAPNPEHVKVIRDFAELKDCLQTVQQVRYIGKELTTDECALEFLKNGIYPGNYEIISYYNGVQSLLVSELESIVYYDSIETLKKDIKNHGFSVVQGKRIVVDVDDKIYNSPTYRDDFMFEVGFDFTATEFNTSYGHLVMQLQSINENIYVSKNIDEFIADINQVTSKNAFANAEFYCKLTNNAFEGYTSGESLVAATGCNVILKSCGGLMGDNYLVYWIIKLDKK